MFFWVALINNVVIPEGADLYKSTEPGFSAFILLYAMKYGLENVHVISRTQTGKWFSWHHRLGQVEAWVVQFVKSLKLHRYGFKMDNMTVVGSRLGHDGKGAASQGKRLTHFIDNDLENLWGIVNDECGNCSTTIRGLLHYTGSRAKGSDDSWDNKTRRLVVKVRSWHEVGEYFGLPYLDEWDYITSQTPPVMSPWNIDLGVLEATLQRKFLEARPSTEESEDEMDSSSVKDDEPAHVRPSGDASSTKAQYEKNRPGHYKEGPEQTDQLLAAVQEGQEQIQQLTKEVSVLRNAVSAVSAASSSSAGDPLGWSHWQSASSGQGNRWYQRKLARAIAHRAAGTSSAPRQINVVMCAWCGRNQPGAFCPYLYCRPCCQWQGAGACEQHSGSV